MPSAPRHGGRPAVVAVATVLVLAVAVGSSGAPALALPAPDAAAELAMGAGWRSWWAAHGRDVATVAGCFLDGVAAARWLALGGSAMAAAGLVAAGLACFG